MSAQVISFPTAAPAQQEPQEKQTETTQVRGWFKMKRSIQMRLMRISLNGRETQILFAVMHKTIAPMEDPKPTDWISLSQLSELTGLEERNISAVKRGLIKRKILIEDGRKIGINLDTDAWEDRKVAKSDDLKSSENNRQNQRMDSPELANKIANSERHIKRERKNKEISNKKINKKVSLSEFVEKNYPSIPVQFIDTALEHRKAKKTAQTENAAKLFFDQIISISNELGISTGHVIDIVILRDWKGVNVEWVRSHLAKNPANPSVRTGGRIVYDPIDTSWADGFDPYDPREL